MCSTTRRPTHRRSGGCCCAAARSPIPSCSARRPARRLCASSSCTRGLRTSSPTCWPATSGRVRWCGCRRSRRTWVPGCSSTGACTRSSARTSGWRTSPGPRPGRLRPGHRHSTSSRRKTSSPGRSRRSARSAPTGCGRSSRPLSVALRDGRRDDRKFRIRLRLSAGGRSAVRVCRGSRLSRRPPALKRNAVLILCVTPGRARKGGALRRPRLLLRASGARFEVEGGRVHAVAKARRLRPVREHVAEVRPAPPAPHLGPHHSVAVVADRHDRLGDDGFRETGPPGAGLELRPCIEQFGTAGRAPVDAVVVAVPVLAREGPFGAGAAEDGELLRRELRPPFVVAFDQFRLGSAHAPSLRRRPGNAAGGRWLLGPPVLYWPLDMPARRVVVDGSNIATEGRTTPSLAQLNEAVLAFLNEYPDSEVTVVVDATFGHRIDPSEVPDFEAAEANNELVSPPAGAIGRGDAFLLRIAGKIGATVLSNDSFQEFHGEHDWLFDEGRLIGGKPIQGIGWIFTPRTPVRGAKSRKAVKDAKQKGRAQAATASGEPLGPAPVPSKPPPRVRRRVAAEVPGDPAEVADAIAVATAESVTGEEMNGRKRRRKKRGARPAEPVNDSLPFITFIAEHPLGSEVEGEVETFTSHGAFILAGGARCYVPISALGDPPPRAARDVLNRGVRRMFVVQALDPQRRGIELALPEFARVAGAPRPETIEAEISEAPSPPGPAPAAELKGRRPAAVRGASSAAAAPRGGLFGARRARPPATPLAPAGDAAARGQEESAPPAGASAGQQGPGPSASAPTTSRRAAKSSRSRAGAPSGATPVGAAAPAHEAGERASAPPTEVAA